MVNEERVRIMTRLAAYESSEGKKYIPVGRYFRSDYIWLQMITSFILGTIAFLIMGAGIVYFFMDEIMDNLYRLDFEQIIIAIVIIYVVFMVIYLLGSFIWASKRYSQARKSLKPYYSDLKKMQKLYEKNAKINE